MNTHSMKFTQIIHNILAILFSFFIVAGLSYDRFNNLQLLYKYPYILFSTCLFFILFFIFKFCIDKTFELLDNIILKNDCDCKKLSLTVGLLFLLKNIPYMMLHYPATFMPDTFWQVSQALGKDSLYSHHPLAHTGVIAACLGLRDYMGGGTIVFLSILCYRPEYLPLH